MKVVLPRKPTPAAQSVVQPDWGVSSAATRTQLLVQGGQWQEGIFCTAVHPPQQPAAMTQARGKTILSYQECLFKVKGKCTAQSFQSTRYKTLTP